MRVSVEEISKLERKLTVVIPAEEVDNKTNDKINELKGRIKVDGFRPGKVPFKVVKDKHGVAIRHDIIADLIQESYFKALEEKELRPAGYPNIKPKDSAFGQELEYTAEFEILPEFALKTLDGSKIEKIEYSISDKDVDNMVNDLLKQHAEWTDTEEGAAKGNQLIIDFSGTIKGEKFDGGESKDFKVELGAGSMLDDFEKPLYGLKAGETTTFKLKFPKDYGDGSVSGKKAEFTVTVHKVKKAKLPELNDEFLKKLGIEDGGEAELRKKIQENMEKQSKDAMQNKLRSNMFDKLIELNKFDLPSVLLDEEINSMQQEMKQQMAMYTGRKPEDIADAPREHFVKDAERRVRLSLIFAETVKKFDIKADAKKVRSKIEERAKSYPNPDEIVNWYFSNKKHLRMVESEVMEDEAIAKLSENVSFDEKKLSISELLKGKK